MAAILAPRIQAWKSDAALAKGKVVKSGSDTKHMAVSAASTDLHLGIVQNVATAAEDVIEVAVPGGGAVALANEAISVGQKLTSHTNGKVKPAASGDSIIAVAQESAVEDDLFPVIVMYGKMP